MSDKRSFHRYALWFPVTVDGATRQMWAVSKDVSAGGILISGTASTADLAVGDVVTLSFRVTPDADEKRVSGRVVRVDATDDNPRAVWPHRMAIEFLEPDATLQAAFERASSRPPPAR